MMKRAATTISTTNAPTKKRQTRSASRRVEQETAWQNADTRRLEEGRQRAQQLSATPLLRALPWVFKSGFLYKHDILKGTEASKEWEEIWNETEVELPKDCLVEVIVDKGRGMEWPEWVQRRGLEADIPSQAFVKQVFDKVIDLKVAAKKTKGQQQKVRDASPKWGQDFHSVELLVWGPTARNDGGIAMSLRKRVTGINSPIFDNLTPVSNFLVRLDPDLRLWTGIRTWSVYDGQPLWAWNFKPSFAWARFLEESDSDGENDE